MSLSDSLSPESACIHAGEVNDQFGAVVTPIYQTSTFRFKDTDHGAALFAGTDEGYIYTRMLNPTIQACENAVAALEGGAYGLGCASGMAAINTIFVHGLRAGDHVVCSDSVYGPTHTLLSTVFSKWGIESTFIDTSDLEAVKRSMRPETRMLFVESPGNPTLVISDIEGCAGIAHAHGAVLVVDNTFMSPILQQPLALGADIVVHSMTKFLNGHADVVAGMIVVKDEETYRSMRKILNQVGGVIDPFNSFLVHRGIKTLALRMERHCTNAQKIAEYLEPHEKVARVYYPGLPSHPQYAIAQKQHKGPGGMITFELKGGIEAGKVMMNNVRLCQLAVSLGGVESLIQHPASMTHACLTKEDRGKAHITDGMVRLSVGVENVDELIADLENAMNKI